MSDSVMDDIEKQLLNTCEILRQLEIIVQDYETDNQGILFETINQLVECFIHLESFEKEAPQIIPFGVLEKIDEFVNPDIYTKECLETCIEKTKDIKVKTTRLELFRQTLEKEMKKNFSNIVEDYKKQVDSPDIFK
ncbi:mediator of RNA polymerase ii transcription subunit 10 [Anaeramoeba ignava]|uniref:Mediator of RNA polymerase II transcription subunit 10 n=1 Tax=Anaeramoeba ignava TaxID=1746090 RepID=A0A9Q0LGB4_ANAIG|nr:mediator of RNA polymerase ii transcription subunit 10 [Anaeramoeba ignava]